MKTLPVRKLYIDSRYLSTGTPAKFEYELPETVDLPKDTVAYITEFTAINGWDTLNESNNLMYIVENPSSGVFHARVINFIYLPHDSETLRAAIENNLNSGKQVAGTYTVSRAASAGTTGSAQLGAAYRYYSISLSGGGQFFIPSEAQLQDPTWYALNWAVAYNGPHYNTQDTRSTNELFSFTMDDFGTNAKSSFIDLRSKHSLFVHSPSFGNYTSIAPRGVRTVLQKIPVEVAYGALIHYEHNGNPADYIEISSSTIKTMKFELRDARGHLVNLNGGHWSMTICFAERPM